MRPVFVRAHAAHKLAEGQVRRWLFARRTAPFHSDRTMADVLDYRPVLRAYPADCQPQTVEFLASAGGFSGARLWRLQTARGLLGLRRWPREHPPEERLEFIQAVLWHVHQEGFERVPLPLETSSHRGYVRHAGHLWELVPWLPGTADYHAAPNPERLRAAMTALAEFHQAVASFPLPEPVRSVSPCVIERQELVRDLLSRGIAAARGAVARGKASYGAAAGRILDLSERCIHRVELALAQAADVDVAMTPCIRDIWHEHVLFEGNCVTGIVDFGAMRVENVAADVARLLGSLVEDDRSGWKAGLAAYESVHPLSEPEIMLVAACDTSGVLLGGLNWIKWLYVDGRLFDQPDRVERRLDYFCRRLEVLAGSR